MKELNVVRKVLNNIGWDLVRYREFLALLIVHDVDLVIDVGANEGQFIRELRFAGYRGQIEAYEPAAGPFERLAEFTRADPKISCSRTALGAVHSELKMHAYDDSRFSSFLPLKNNPYSFREEIVQVTTLDTEFQDRDLLSRFKRPFLKIDTQGYERAVLEGASAAMSNIFGVLMECSLTPIYEGQWTVEEAISFMRQRRFAPWAVRRGFRENYREYEMDIIFFRDTIT